MVISDFFHLRLGASVGGDQQHSYSFKVFRPQVHLSVGGGGGGGGGGEGASSLSSKHKLWNFHRSC